MSWSGAHPTGGLVANENSPQAQYEEYPFVLLECRGDSRPRPQPGHAPDVLDPVLDGALPGQPRRRVPALPARPVRPPGRSPPWPLPPRPSPPTCAGEDAPVQYWVPFVAASGQVFHGGNGGCGGEAPEAVTSTFGGPEQRDVRVDRHQRPGERRVRRLHDNRTPPWAAPRTCRAPSSRCPSWGSAATPGGPAGDRARPTWPSARPRAHYAPGRTPAPALYQTAPTWP